MLPMTNVYLTQDDLAARIAATLEFGKKHYRADPTRGSTWLAARREREAAFEAATRVLPQEFVKVARNLHSGYYGSMAGLVWAMGWTRGPPSNEVDAAEPNPPPQYQLDLGCPSYGDEYSHIREMHELGKRTLRGLGRIEPRLLKLSDEDLEHAGAANVTFANVTPYQAERSVDPVEEDWSEFYPLFSSLFREARPLVLVGVGRFVVRRFCEQAFPGVSTLPPQKFPRDYAGGRSYARRWGIIRVEGIPTGYLELPVHPSMGYASAYRESAGRIAGELACEALSQRRKQEA